MEKARLVLDSPFHPLAVSPFQFFEFPNPKSQIPPTFHAIIAAKRRARRATLNAENLPKVYDPKETESRWYRFWEENDLFHAVIDESRRPFTIVIPPPNVTGSLHMGHALNNTLQDVLIRFNRMRGNVALWVPGTDHAGIATQNKVEQQLEAEGLTRHDIGREKFIERVWAWKEEYGSTIIGQLKRLGCSCDWSRERFTMDEGYSRAVREVFVRLYRDGLIYKGHRLINWCPRCHTALSDIEVEHHDVAGKLWHIRYKIEGTDEYLVIATTRPETLLGDTAVAVHPDDSRYSHLVGKYAVLPLVGRKLRIIADEYVNQEFGTGALKVTPAHDPNDFDLGIKHGLEQINILNDDGTINANGGVYQGLDTLSARARVEADLEKQGLLEGVEEHAHSVGHCYRCQTVIEPYLSDQWFVDMKPLAGPAVDAVREGRVKFAPPKWERLYFDWMGEIRDWCISRQIWWGHQIPAWYCGECGEINVAREAPEACAKCGSTALTQETDVLDTWFSSALWPFAVLGWPDDTPELRYFYPTSVLSTARDILYLWVARMIMTGLKFPGDVPFHTVIIHPTVLNSEGKRMSKSLGTGVDPLGLIDTYGTDATRFGLMVQVTPLQDMRFTEDKLAMSRNFANKIWNASRFVMMNLGDWQEGEPPSLETLEDRWILSRGQELTGEVTAALAGYNFSEASRLLYDFFWGEFCDWYLELVKGRLGEGVQGDTARWVLAKTLDATLRLLHPFMPFITEEIWQNLPLRREQDGPKSIMLAAWPEVVAGLIDEGAELEMGFLQDVITGVRAIRAAFGLSPRLEVDVLISVDEAKAGLVQRNSRLVSGLVNARKVEVGTGIARPAGAAAQVIAGGTVFVPLVGVIDVEKERARLTKELERADKELEAVARKLSNQGYLSKAAPEVILKDRAKREQVKGLIDKLNEQLEWL